MNIPELEHTYGNKRIPIFRHIFMVLGFYSCFYFLWFLPALYRDQLLGAGDGYIQSLPAYYASRTLWSTQLLGGYPVAADVTPQTWYPVSLLLRLFPNSWNSFVISSYVLASVFNYSYTYVITRSILASLIAGLIYGASGFMMTYVSQTSMIHTSAWVPLTFLACEQLLRSGRKIWMVILSIGVACLFLAGHPQISIYGFTLLIIYAGFFGSLKTNRWLFYSQFIISIFIGLGLASIQLFPTVELVPLTIRSVMTFKEFITLSMPLSHTITAVFPYVLGINGSSIILPYIGVVHDAYIYMGLLPMTLAIRGLYGQECSRYFRYFWAFVALVSFLLILGEATPLAWISYQVPIYNKFRIMTRHSMEFSISISILAGLGISCISHDQYNWKKLKKLFQFSLILMIMMLFWSVIVCLYLLQRQNITNALEKTSIFLGVGTLPSLMIFILGWVGLAYHAKKQSIFSMVTLLVILSADLGFGSWFYAWHEGPISTEVLSQPLFLQQYQSKLAQHHQRFFPLQGGNGSADEAPPNLSRMWNSPSMSGYGPLLLSRVAEFITISNTGELTSRTLLVDSKDLSLDLAAVRYVTTTTNSSEGLASSDDNPTKWSQENLLLSLGKVCITEPRKTTTIDLPEPIIIDSIHIVGSLGCSTTIAQGTNVLEIRAIDINGKSESYFLKAGEHLSESAINRPDVASEIKHRTAKVFKQFPIEGQSWLGNSYVSKTSLIEPSVIRQLQIYLPQENTGAVVINKISLNNSRVQSSYPLIGERWRYVKDLEPPQMHKRFYPILRLSKFVEKTRIYENRNVLPRAWLTSQVQSSQPDQILAAVKTSKLPNGLIFDPREKALIEEPIDFPDQIQDPNATVQVEFPSETQVRLQTRSTQPSFLVLSDVFYPGWQAYIDGKPAHIFQTNYIFRGVQLPAGDHTVTFSFRPLSFAIGCGISGASFALLLYIAFTDRRSKPKALAILPS